MKDDLTFCPEHRELEEELNGLRGLLRVAQMVVSSLDIGEVLQNILTSALEIMEMPAGSIALVDEATRQLDIHAWVRPRQEQIGRDRLRIKPEGLVRRVLDDGELIVIEDTVQSSYCHDPLVMEDGVAALIAVPLKIQQKRVGILFLEDFHSRQFPPGRLKILPVHASFAAMSIDNARLHQKTQQLAATDGLTGLLNHREFKRLLKEEMGRAIRYQNPLSLVMFDIDDFKKFNDVYGHPVGDRVLQTVARHIRESFRDCDGIFRYGGEEFVVILPETDLEAALVAAERARCRIEEDGTRGLQGAVDGGITVSVGAAAYPRDGKDAEKLLVVVDKLLYQAKYQGKNKIHFHRLSL